MLVHAYFEESVPTPPLEQRLLTLSPLHSSDKLGYLSPGCLSGDGKMVQTMQDLWGESLESQTFFM